MYNILLALFLFSRCTFQLQTEDQQMAALPNKICQTETECYRKFSQWKQTFAQNKWNPQEQMYRDYIFSNNAKKITAHNNLPNLTYKMKINQFSTLTKSQFQEKTLMYNRKELKNLKINKNQNRILQNSLNQWNKWFTPLVVQTKTIKNQSQINQTNNNQKIIIQQKSQLNNSQQSLVTAPTQNRLKQNSNRLMQNFTGIPNGGDGIRTIDWVARGIITPSKNQGFCGACWAFTSVTITQSIALTYNSLESPNHSEQQLIDCTNQQGNFGCQGGWSQLALTHVLRSGITTQQEYPYLAKSGRCLKNQGLFRIKSLIKGQGCQALEQVVLQRPVTVGIDATFWQQYGAGIFVHEKKNNTIFDINHQVVIIAFNQRYWRAKNSWSERWGQQGTIRLAKGNTGGICQERFIGAK